MDLPVGEDRFEVVGLLGKGACGKVLHVRDRRKNGAELALKILESGNVLDNHARERFIKEILILCSIDHKNIVAAYEVIKYEGKDAYTMELVKGENLAHYLQRWGGKPLSMTQIDSIMTQLMLAVGELHRRKIIHRDIKLENILLREDGLVKLNDLGLIKVIGESPMTDPGILLGTAYYMPPEYILNKPVDNRADIYACGIILWELLSGKRRFAETNGEKILRELMTKNFAHPEPNLAGERKKYARILKKALAVDKEQRFENAEQMMHAFDGIFPRERGSKYTSSDKFLFYLIAVAVVTLAIVLIT